MADRMQQERRRKGRDVLQDLSRHKGAARARVCRLHKYLFALPRCRSLRCVSPARPSPGSGEVESAHRTIPQERLKLPGTWWHPDAVNLMLALRVVRVNG